MKITNIRLTKCEGKGNQLAEGSITFEDDFAVSGIGVALTEDGQRIVTFPSCKTSKGEYKEICFPMTRALMEDIHLQVISAYEKLIEI